MKGDRLYHKALSKAYSEETDLESIFELLERSLAQNNPKAAYALGTWYLHGKYVR
ncbi:hypothetical protein [Mucilaginibacter sp.]|uniref:hypothetical protein n=1 Tax=Mucilaginibacter sp. TaxID=1882438 RepID=UPI0025D0C041|nr:hypothetical protein [Mucilaginibacter sp.]